MAITLGNSFKTGALDGGLGAINAGTGDVEGDLEFLTSADVSLAVLDLSPVAFAAAAISGANAVSSSNPIFPSGTPTAGTITKGRFRNKANVPVISFSVSTSGGGGDIIMGAVVIAPGTTSVSCSGMTMTATFA